MDLRNFLADLGNLHDCTITRLDWKRSERIVALEIEDLYFNFHGLPEYPGATSGCVILLGVKHITIDIDDTPGCLRIYDFTLEEQSEPEETANIAFWLSGRMKVVFKSAILPEVILL